MRGKAGNTYYTSEWERTPQGKDYELVRESTLLSQGRDSELLRINDSLSEEFDGISVSEE